MVTKTRSPGRFAFVDSRTQWLADIVCELFTVLGNHWRKRTDPLDQWDKYTCRWNGGLYRNAWQPLAIALRDRHLDPDAFLSQTWAAAAESRNWPKPHDLLKSDAIHQFKRSTDLALWDAATALPRYRKHLREGLELDQLEGRSPILEFCYIAPHSDHSTPLFFYCTGSEFLQRLNLLPEDRRAIRRLLGDLRPKALREYQSWPLVLDDAWGRDFIPRELQDTVPDYFGDRQKHFAE